jgi:hypothetical protein
MVQCKIAVVTCERIQRVITARPSHTATVVIADPDGNDKYGQEIDPLPMK